MGTFIVEILSPIACCCYLLRFIVNCTDTANDNTTRRSQMHLRPMQQGQIHHHQVAIKMQHCCLPSKFWPIRGEQKKGSKFKFLARKKLHLYHISITKLPHSTSIICYHKIITKSWFCVQKTKSHSLHKYMSVTFPSQNYAGINIF